MTIRTMGSHVADDVTQKQPHPGVRDEALRLLSLIAASGTPLYLLGGLAIEIRRGDAPTLLAREYKDIDFITPKGKGRDATLLIENAGYRADFEFNALNGRRRLLFWDDANMRQIDVFVGEFEMSHTLPLGDALRPGAQTIVLADLLATKLQIYELNPKDEIDILNLLYHHDVGDEGEEDDAISAARIAQLCADDWCFWRTAKLNIERTTQALDRRAVPAEAAELIRSRLLELWGAVESHPKPAKWRLRNRVGDRVRWYETPEETR